MVRENTKRTRCALTKRTIVTRHLTCGTAALVGYATNATNITFTVPLIVISVPGVPSPLGDSVP